MRASPLNTTLYRIKPPGRLRNLKTTIESERPSNLQTCVLVNSISNIGKSVPKNLEEQKIFMGKTMMKN